MKMTAKQKCKYRHIINDLFHFSDKPLDHIAKATLIPAWEEQSWLSVTLINGFISYCDFCFEANNTSQNTVPIFQVAVKGQSLTAKFYSHYSHAF